jgi:hypothetical protein
VTEAVHDEQPAVRVPDDRIGRRDPVHRVLRHLEGGDRDRRGDPGREEIGGDREHSGGRRLVTAGVRLRAAVGTGGAQVVAAGGGQEDSGEEGSSDRHHGSHCRVR